MTFQVKMSVICNDKTLKYLKMQKNMIKDLFEK